MKYSGCFCLILGLVFLGCRTTGPKFDPRAEAKPSSAPLTEVNLASKSSALLLQPAEDAFRLGPGDRFEIELFGETPMRRTVTVGPDGRIYFYLLPGLDVWGLTLPQAKNRIEQELSDLMTTAPQVGLTMRTIESQRLYVLGRLQNAGVYPMAHPITLLEAISMAGGTVVVPGSAEEVADLERGFVVRDGVRLPVNFSKLLREGDMSQNIYLQPDDFVYVPSARSTEIYVLGAVRAPRAAPPLHEPSLVAVISSAGGVIPEAYPSQVAIVRGSLSEPKIAIVNYEEIVEGRAPDVRLEPRDIVYVPFSPYRTLARYADLILTTFARALAINEGARAVSRNPLPVGVNIGIGTQLVP